MLGTKPSRRESLAEDGTSSTSHPILLLGEGMYGSAWQCMARYGTCRWYRRHQPDTTRVVFRYDPSNTQQPCDSNNDCDPNQHPEFLEENNRTHGDSDAIKDSKLNDVSDFAGQPPAMQRQRSIQGRRSNAPQATTCAHDPDAQALPTPDIQGRAGGSPSQKRQRRSNDIRGNSRSPSPSIMKFASADVNTKYDPADPVVLEGAESEVIRTKRRRISVQEASANKEADTRISNKGFSRQRLIDTQSSPYKARFTSVDNPSVTHLFKNLSEAGKILHLRTNSLYDHWRSKTPYRGWMIEYVHSAPCCLGDNIII